MATLTVNGVALKVQLVDVELAKLKLDAENPRLHSSYLTHQLKSNPDQSDIARVLESLPEFESLYNSIARNNGCFEHPVTTRDYRILEGNRRVVAVRALHRDHPKNVRWKSVTVQKIISNTTPQQEKAIKAKYHLEGVLAWDGLSQITEYLEVAERDGEEVVAEMLGRPRHQIEPLLIAGRCMRKFSQKYPDVHSPDLLWVLVGLCGIKNIEPTVTFSRATRLILTDNDKERPLKQSFSLEQYLRWIAEGKFTKPYKTEDKTYTIKLGNAPKQFKQLCQSGEEALAYFHEADGSLAKALAMLESGQATSRSREKQLLNLTRKFIELLQLGRQIKREENPDLYREITTAYFMMEKNVIGIKRKENRNVHTPRHKSGRSA